MTAFAGAQQPAVRTTPANPGDPGNVLSLILSAITGRATAPGAGGAPALIMSPIDKLLGGEAMMGSKTMIAIIGAVLMTILQVAGALTPGGAAASIITALLGGLGGLGGVAKIDRVVQALGLIAARPR